MNRRQCQKIRMREFHSYFDIQILQSYRELYGKNNSKPRIRLLRKLFQHQSSRLFD